MSTAADAVARPPPWKTCLDIEGQDALHYQDFVNEALYQAIDGEPGRVLEIGCATGMFGKTLKERHPGCHVTGIEAGHGAAAVARTRLDRVIDARIEDIDFAALGIAPASFDLVIAGDVLEHLHNPWGALTRVHPLIAPGGRLVVSLPNVRNLMVISSLIVAGRFEYAERGLLDITHLRFFTLDDIRIMIESTGYALEAFSFTLSRGLTKLFHEHEGKDKVTIQVGKMTLADVTPRELMELCAETYAVRARVKR